MYDSLGKVQSLIVFPGMCRSVKENSVETCFYIFSIKNILLSIHSPALLNYICVCHLFIATHSNLTIHEPFKLFIHQLICLSMLLSIHLDVQ